MKKTLSYIPLLTAALLLCASCQKAIDPVDASSRISFSVDGSDIMRVHDLTKAAEVTTSTLEAAGFKVTGTTGTAGSEVEAFTNVNFTKRDGVFTGNAWWPATEPAGGYHFYASNAPMTFHPTGATVAADNSTDVVTAYLPSPDFGEENELHFQHVFSRLYSVNVLQETGYTISDVSVRMTPVTGGTYDIREGEGHADLTGWSATTTGSETAIATAVGDNTPDIYFVPGHYVIKVSWTATIGGSIENFVDETVEYDFESGKKGMMELTLGGNAQEMKFRMAVVPWAETLVAPTAEFTGSLNQHLTFEIINDGTITWKCSNASIAKTIYYRKNGGEWTELTSTTAGATIDVVADDIIEFYGEDTYYATSYSNYNSFGGTADFYAYGNIQSLTNFNNNTATRYTYAYLFRNSKIHSHNTEHLFLPATRLSEYCYYGMFYGCKSLTTTPELPATELATYCYNDMFYGCSSLTAAPELPATTLAPSCYRGMFSQCSSLTIAPELPSTTLEAFCYQAMFASCTSLTTTPELPATTMKNSCYANMFAGCTNLTIAPELPATSLESNCYSYMFYNCSNLTVAPELPATTLASSCYSFMFYGCSSLTATPELPATILASSCYYDMFYGCSSLTAAPELPATVLVSSCYYEMFYNCRSLTAAPELPATTLASSCYVNMFYGCSSLTTAPELPATALESNCYNGMFFNCTKLATAPVLPATTLAQNCYKSMFNNFSSLTAAPELPATTLESNCYNNMFYNCNKLEYVKCLATDISATNCTLDWLRNTKSTGTFVKHPDMSSWPTSTSGIPAEWTVEDATI